MRVLEFECAVCEACRIISEDYFNENSKIVEKKE